MADFQQALPNQYPDLGALFENMPAIAAGQVGIQQRIADQNNQSLQDAFAAQQQFDAQKRPLDLQQLMATTRNTNSQADYHGALARGANADSSLKEGTLDSNIASTNSGNKTKMGADQIAQLEQVGDLYRQVGAQVAGEPTPWGKVAKAKELLGDHVQQGPEFDKFLLKHASNLHTYFSDLGDNIYNASRAAKVEAGKEATATERAKIAADATKYAADQRTNAVGLKIDNTPDKPETMSQYEARIRAEAATGDPKAIAQVQKLEQDKRDKAMASAGVADAFKRELLNMPQGTKANDDGTFTLPDGRIVRKKK